MEDEADDDDDLDDFLKKVARAPAIGSHPETVIGSTIAGRFVVEAHAGTGGMGAVYRAHDNATDQIVALKILAGGAEPEAIERMLREARVLAELSHPGIVRYLDHGTLGAGEPYLVMEWLAGEDLAVRLARGTLAIGEASALIAKVATTLASAHDRGIVHRDLKPQNLFLVGGDLSQVKLLDFGLARALDAERYTRTGTSVGTPAYMSPEQARGAKQLDARADIYSLGCTLFECLAGAPPLTAASVPDLLTKLLFGTPPSIKTLRADVPDGIDKLLARMLAKDPAARPSARDAALLLAHCGS